MSDKICIRCGQVLNKWAMICPDCKAVQKSDSKTQNHSFTDVSRQKSVGHGRIPSEDVLFDDIFDTDAVSVDTKRNASPVVKRFSHETYKSNAVIAGKVWSVIGFVLGSICPWIFVIIILAANRSKKIEFDGWPFMKKGMLWGMILIQIAIPALFAVIGFLIS